MNNKLFNYVIVVLLLFTIFFYPPLIGAWEGSQTMDPGVQQKIDQGTLTTNDIVFIEDFERTNWQQLYIDSWPGGTVLSWLPAIYIHGDSRIERTTGTGVFNGSASLKTTQFENNTGDDVAKDADYFYLFQGPGYDELYMRWYQKFENSSAFQSGFPTSGLKGYGLYGWIDGKPYPAANGSTTNPRFSFRASVGQVTAGNLSPHVYTYFFDNGTEPYNSSNVTYFNNPNRFIIPNQYHCIEIQLKPNTFNGSGAPLANGEVRMWFDNELVNQQTGKILRGRADAKIKSIDNTARWPDGAAGNQVRWEDNLVVAKNRIGCIDSTPTKSPTPSPTATPALINGINVTASGHDGNVPANTLDNNLATRWSAFGDGQWIQYDMGSSQVVRSVGIALYQGDTRSLQFDLILSSDGNTWIPVLTNKLTSGTTTGLETHDIPDQSARYIRIVGHGNTVTDWNSITEVQLNTLNNLPGDINNDGSVNNQDLHIVLQNISKSVLNNDTNGDGKVNILDAATVVVNL